MASDWQTTVTVQVRREWPSKTYRFRDRAQALMFAASCKRDNDFRVSVSA